MHDDLLIHNIAQLVTVAGPAGPRRGAAMRELGIINRGAVAIRDGLIAAVGPKQEPAESVQADAHLDAGGGIVRTVTDTRAAPLDQLVRETAERATRMFRYGTTTAEAKTGYGLNIPDELKQLEAIAILQGQGPLDLAPTFLGARAVPTEYRGRTDAYVDLVVEEMLPAAWVKWEELRHAFPQGWPIFCDAFCEDGAFDLAQSRRILEADKQANLAILDADDYRMLPYRYGTNLVREVVKRGIVNLAP